MPVTSRGILRDSNANYLCVMHCLKPECQRSLDERISNGQGNHASLTTSKSSLADILCKKFTWPNKIYFPMFIYSKFFTCLRKVIQIYICFFS